MTLLRCGWKEKEVQAQYVKVGDHTALGRVVSSMVYKESRVLGFEGREELHSYPLTMTVQVFYPLRDFQNLDEVEIYRVVEELPPSISIKSRLPVGSRILFRKGQHYFCTGEKIEDNLEFFRGTDPLHDPYLEKESAADVLAEWSTYLHLCEHSRKSDPPEGMEVKASFSGSRRMVKAVFTKDEWFAYNDADQSWVRRSLGSCTSWAPKFPEGSFIWSTLREWRAQDLLGELSQVR